MDETRYKRRNSSENIREREHKTLLGVDGFLIFNVIFEEKGVKM
jgi:hypothetical protein